MSALQKFAFGPLDVRVVELEGNPWFVASDVRRALGIAQAGTNFSFLSANEIRPLPRGLTSAKGMGTAKILAESGVYKLVMRSDKPEAKAFQDWVTRVVLPAIRKDGAYVMGEEKVATGELSEDELVMRAMTIMTRKVDRLTQERDQLARDKQALAITNEALLPAATVGQALAKRKALGVVDFCRKLPGVAVNAVQTRLYDMQYLHKKPGHWSVYAKFKGVLFDETYDHLGYSKVVALEAGQNKLVELYHKGLLPMLKGRKPEKALELGA